jgi:hypothetical protein
MINNQEEMKNDHDGPRLRPGLLYAGAGLLIIIAGVAIWQWQRRENGSSLAGRPVPKVATSPVGASGASALPVDLTRSTNGRTCRAEDSGDHPSTIRLDSPNHGDCPAQLLS